MIEMVTVAKVHCGLDEPGVFHNYARLNIDKNETIKMASRELPVFVIELSVSHDCVCWDRCIWFELNLD